MSFGMNERQSGLEIYFNKPVCVHVNGNCFYGVLLPIKEGQRFIEVQPSLVSNPDGSEVSIVKDMPTRIYGEPFAVRPMPEGMLERFIEGFIESQKKIKLK